MSPFDLSGPGFLALWFWGAVVVAGVTVVVRGFVRGPRGGAEELAAELDAYDLAYLAGGMERAVEAAIVGLHHRGAIEVTGGKISVKPGAQGVFRGVVAADRVPPIARLVLQHGDQSVDRVLAYAHGLEPDFEARARANGLLVGDARRARVLVALPGLAWIAFGAMKLAVGLARDRPVGFLAAMLLAGIAAVVYASRIPRRTRRGDAVLEAAKLRSYGLEATARTAPGQLASEDAARGYGLFGYSILGELALLSLMPSYQRSLVAASSGADGGSGGSACSSCSSSSSCGGGCGGGCGGCS